MRDEQYAGVWVFTFASLGASVLHSYIFIHLILQIEAHTSS